VGNLLMIQPLRYVDVVIVADLVSADAPFPLQFLEPHLGEPSRIVVVGIEQAREHS
jgi:hypothetical protein